MFYDVDEDYTNYLRKYEDKIPYISYTGKEKFICGVVLSVNKCDYYAPISSFNVKQFTNFPIYHKSKIVSSIRFSYMFPTPLNCLTKKNFNLEKDKKYKDLLQNEWNYCLIHSDEIKNKAEYIYRRYLSGQDELLIKHSCNFPLLEHKMREYIVLKQTLVEVAITEDNIP